MGAWLSKSELGVYAYCIAAASFASELTTMGANPIVVRRIAGKASGEEVVGRNALFLRLIVPSLSAVVIMLVIASLSLAIEHFQLMLLAFAACSVGQVSGFFKQLFIAKQKFWYHTYSEQVGLLVRVVTGITLVRTGFGAKGMIVALLVGYCIETLFSALTASRKLSAPLIPKLDIPEFIATLREGLPLLGLVIFNQALARADWFIMGISRTASETGEYAFAYRMFEATWLPHAILGTLLLPKLSAIFHDSGAEVELKARLTSLHRLMVAVSVILPLALVLVWTPVVDHFTGGKYGAVNQTVVQILCLSVPFAAGTGLFWNAAIAAQRSKTVFFASGISSSLNLAMNLVLVPRFGAIGAALSTTIPFIVQYIIYAASMHSLYWVGSAVGSLLKCLVAGAMTFGALSMFQMNWAANVIVGVVVYAAAAAAIFGFSFDEIHKVTGAASLIRKPRFRGADEQP